MERGWKARESLDFELAETLLKEAKSLFAQAKDWYNVTECLNHLAYTYKMQSDQLLNQGIAATQEAESISATRKTKPASVLRAKISLLSAKGLYEEALKTAHQLLKTVDRPANKADVFQHIAMYELRTGHLTQAKKSIAKAEYLLAQGWEEEREPHRSIWKVSILLTKGLIYHNLRNPIEAKKCGKESLIIATTNNLQARAAQAEAFMKTITSSS